MIYDDLLSRVGRAAQDSFMKRAMGGGKSAT
jgi:hypothetical protein